MLRILQHFILTTIIAVFASQASAMFIQADWWDPTEPGVGTNRYAYSHNDPINLADPGGNAPDYGYGVANSYYTGSQEPADPTYSYGGGTRTIHQERVYIGRETGTVYHDAHTMQSYPNTAGIARTHAEIEAFAQHPEGSIPAAVGGYLNGDLSLNQAMNVATTGTVQGGLPTAGPIAQRPASSVVSSAALRRQLTAQSTAPSIANGHAFEKHVLQQAEFGGLGIRTRAQFQSHIENVMTNPSATRTLNRNRTAYWDGRTGTVVIRDPNSVDLGTAFRPTNGRAYFDGLN